MKLYSILFIVISLVFLLAPVAAVERQASPDSAVSETNGSSTAPSAKAVAAEAEEGEAIKVFRSSTKKVETVSELEYLVGAVAAEMPASYHEEALKAQAVACYTYALYNKNKQAQSPSSDLLGAYLSDSPSAHQGYISKAERKEKWGEKYDAYEAKTEKAVKDVLGKAITFDGEYIMASFHAICSGKTESAKIVWGEDIPYLKSVISSGDKLSPNYSDTLALTTEQFAEIMLSLNEAELDEDASEWLGSVKTSESGIVTSVEIGGVKYNGSEIRTVFGLRSSAFTLSYDDGSFVIKTVGYGHFVGMSQYGADYMARQGSTWKEILNHYYTGVKISDV